ncbi:MAG: hypothetical protein IID55_14590 [Proteobacteria bacterium]|nr:hypothetical protein [Pseudomonadota bacterium]
MPLQTLRVDTDAIPAAVGDDEAPAAGEDAPASQAVLALLDVVEGARASYLWGRRGWQDIRQRLKFRDI